MGRVAFSIDIERVEDDEKITLVKIDLGGNNVISPEFYTSPGVDSAPMDGDYVATSSAPGNSGQSAVGTIDPINGGVAGKGEVRLYARDEDGNTIIALYLKSDGTIEIGGSDDNAVRFAPLKSGFDLLIDQINANFQAISTDLAAIATAAGATATYPPLQPTLEPTASIDDSKVEEIKVP